MDYKCSQTVEEEQNEQIYERDSILWSKLMLFFLGTPKSQLIPNAKHFIDKSLSNDNKQRLANSFEFILKNNEKEQLFSILQYFQNEILFKNNSNIKLSHTKNIVMDMPSSLLLTLNTFQYDPKLPIMFGLAFNPYVNENIFAVCGDKIAIVYECLNRSADGLLPLFAHSDPNDCYYSCCWSYDIKKANHHYLIVAGKKGVIRVINIRKQKEVKTYYGHGAAINDLKVCPLDPTLLLSASKDFGIRLWNLSTDACVAIFGGVMGHRDQVIAIDFHQEKSIFASVSIDHSIKIWSLKDHEVAKAIEQSRTFLFNRNNKQFPTILQHYPNFSTRHVHNNYIDSIQWFGDFLITKSCDENLVIWKPGKPSETLDQLMLRFHHSECDSNQLNVFIIRQFKLIQNDLWFIKFSLDLNELLLAIGNHQGHVFIYDLKYDHSNRYRLAFDIPTPNIHNQKVNRVVRQTAFSPNGKILIALNENSCVTRYDIIRITRKKLHSYLLSFPLVCYFYN